MDKQATGPLFGSHPFKALSLGNAEHGQKSITGIALKSLLDVELEAVFEEAADAAILLLGSCSDEFQRPLHCIHTTQPGSTAQRQ